MNPPTRVRLRLQRIGGAYWMQPEEPQRMLTHAIGGLHFKPTPAKRVQQRSCLLPIPATEVPLSLQAGDGRRTLHRRPHQTTGSMFSSN